MTSPQTIALGAIEALDIDDYLQGEDHAAVVARFVKAMKEGDIFPPILIVANGEKLFLGDGFHRFKAHQELGKTEIAAKVINEAAYRDALRRGWYFY